MAHLKGRLLAVRMHVRTGFLGILTAFYVEIILFETGQIRDFAHRSVEDCITRDSGELKVARRNRAET